jgi:hypothetical protein
MEYFLITDLTTVELIHISCIFGLKLSSSHALKSYKGHRVIAPVIVNLGSRGRWVVNFTPWLSQPRKEARYPFTRMRGGLQSWSGHSGEEKNLLSLLGCEPQNIQPIVYLLYRLHCHNFCMYGLEYFKFFKFFFNLVSQKFLWNAFNLLLITVEILIAHSFM